MKKITRTLFSAILVAMLSLNSAYSQFEEVGDILKSGTSDANILLNAYLEPIGKGWGYDLAGGWYNTAKPHNTLGFSLNFAVNMAQIPDHALTFDIADLNLEKITAVEPGNNIFPTIVNGDDANEITIVETVEVQVEGTDQTMTEDIVILPPTELSGFSTPFVPLPTLTGSVGLIKNTDLSLRFIPTIGMGDYGSIGMWGVGLKHDILQWLPVVDKVPFLNASVFGGYSRLGFGFDIPYTVPDVDDDMGYVNPENQKLDASLSAFHGALLVDVSLPLVTPYASIGLTRSKMTMDVLGEYALPKHRYNEDTQDIESFIDADDPNFTLNDPLNLEFNNKLAPSVALGLRVKLAVITFYGQYTYQDYSMVTAGFGISFR